MESSWLEAVIIAVILGGIAFTIFRGGAANPVGTGSLSKKLTTLDGDVKALRTQVDGVDIRVTEIDRRGATNADIERLEARVTQWERKFDQLDERLDGVERELARIGNTASGNKLVIEAMAASLRETNAAMQKIESRIEANAAITAQVPAFMEKVLTNVARGTARTEEVCKQVDRLYDFIVERGMK